MKNFVVNKNYFYEDLHLLSFGKFFIEKQRKYLHGVIFDVDTDGIFVSFNKNLPLDNMIASFKLCENIYFDNIKTRIVQRCKDTNGGNFVKLEFTDLSQKEKKLFEECIPKWRIKQFIENWY
jgi:hypothetical protein